MSGLWRLIFDDPRDARDQARADAEQQTAKQEARLDEQEQKQNERERQLQEGINARRRAMISRSGRPLLYGSETGVGSTGAGMQSTLGGGS